MWLLFPNLHHLVALFTAGMVCARNYPHGTTTAGPSISNVELLAFQEKRCEHLDTPSSCLFRWLMHTSATFPYNVDHGDQLVDAVCPTTECPRVYGGRLVVNDERSNSDGTYFSILSITTLLSEPPSIKSTVQKSMTSALIPSGKRSALLLGVEGGSLGRASMPVNSFFRFCFNLSHVPRVVDVSTFITAVCVSWGGRCVFNFINM